MNRVKKLSIIVLFALSLLAHGYAAELGLARNPQPITPSLALNPQPEPPG